VWMVRKAGLSLLTGCVGPKKPVAFIEDVAVRPAQLPDYVRGLQSIMKSLGLEASYYGHAASGLLHVRPALNLHNAEDLRKYRLVADRTSVLVRQFKGSISAEHGVGIARTEYMRDQLGDSLLNVMREIKQTFDPKNIFNPGKIFGFAYKIDNHLRLNFARPIELPFEPRLAYAFKDHSFVGNLEQCNGCGGLPETNRHHVPDVYGNARRSDVHPRPRQHHSALARITRERAGSAEIGRARSGVEQLFVMQGLHSGMPVEREPRLAQGGNASRALETRWAAAAGKILQ